MLARCSGYVPSLLLISIDFVVLACDGVSFDATVPLGLGSYLYNEIQYAVFDESQEKKHTYDDENCHVVCPLS